MIFAWLPAMSASLAIGELEEAGDRGQVGRPRNRDRERRHGAKAMGASMDPATEMSASHADSGQHAALGVFDIGKVTEVGGANRDTREAGACGRDAVSLPVDLPALPFEPVHADERH